MLPRFAVRGEDGTTAVAAGGSLGGEGGWGGTAATAGKEGVDTDVQGGGEAVRVASAATVPPLHGAGVGPRWPLGLPLGSAEDAAEAMHPRASIPTADDSQGGEGATVASAAAEAEDGRAAVAVEGAESGRGTVAAATAAGAEGRDGMMAVTEGGTGSWASAAVAAVAVAADWGAQEMAAADRIVAADRGAEAAAADRTDEGSEEEEEEVGRVSSGTWVDTLWAWPERP